MISLSKIKRNKRQLRHRRVRGVVSGTAQRPRLSVFRSSSHLYAQLIDDQSGKTLASASSRELKGKAGNKASSAQAVGDLISAKAKDKKISQVVFDRGGYKYTGRVKALADAARAGGLEF